MNNQNNPVPTSPQPYPIITPQQPARQKASGVTITALVLSIIAIVMVLIFFIVNLMMWFNLETDFLVYKYNHDDISDFPQWGNNATADDDPEVDYESGVVYEGAVQFDDPVVEVAIRKALALPAGPVTEEDMLGIEILNINSEDENASVASIDALKYCKNLTSLSISHDVPHTENGETYYWGRESDLQDISPLKELDKLEILYLSYTQVTDITPLNGHTSLIDLHLNAYGKKNLKGLELIATFTNLESLSLEGYQVPDISFVSKLTKLTRLSFWWCGVKDIKPISKLTKLEFLQLGGLESGDLKPIENLQNLTFINLADFQIKSIDPIKKLTKLEHAGLYRLGLTEAQQKDLQKALPSCEFEFGL